MLNSLFTNLKKNQFLALVFVFLIAFIPRLIMLFTRRFSAFGTEPARDLLTARDIIYSHIFPLVGSNYPYGYAWHIPKGPGWYYFLTIPIIFGNGDPFWAKAMTGLVGIITIIFSFFILKSAFNLKTAIAAAVLLSISPWFIEQSGLVWPPYIVVFPVALFLFSVMKVLQKKQQFVLLIALSIGLMAQFEIAIALFYIAQMLILIPFAIKYKYISYKTLFFSFVVLFLVFLPNALYDFIHGFSSAGGISTIMRSLVDGGLNNIIQLLGQRVDVFTWNFRSTFSPNIIKSICLLLIICVGGYLFIKDKKNIRSQKLFLIYLALTPLAKFAILLFYPGNVLAWHLLDLTILYCFLLGIIFGYFLEKSILKILSIAVLIALIIIFSVRMSEIFRNEFVFSFGMNRIPQAASVDYIFSDAQKQPFNYISLDASQIRPDFDYLFWWYGTKKYHLKPSIVPQKLRYYIFDGNDPTVEKIPKNFSGTIVGTKDFPFGYTVKKVIY